MRWEFASNPSVAALRALAAPASPVSTQHPHEDAAENTSAQAGRRTRTRTASPAQGSGRQGGEGAAPSPRHLGHGRSSGQGGASAGHDKEADPRGGGEDSRDRRAGGERGGHQTGEETGNRRGRASGRGREK